jgi:ankyrin repeat protein
MKKQFIITITAVLLVGCGKTAPGISIHEAATQGNLNRIKDLIAAGEDVDKKYEGKLQRREFIVEVKDRLQGYSGNYWFKGYSPLHLAAMNGHEPVIKYLIANGADLNATSTGGTPLHLAIRWEGATFHWLWGSDYGHKFRNHKIAKSLISEGADLNMTQGGGQTILYKNITDISADFLEYLVANGADVNMKNAKGFTPLHRAVASRSPSPKKIEFLISHGAKVNARTKAGTTPLDWVIENKKISDLLRKHGGKRSEELKTLESE